MFLSDMTEEHTALKTGVSVHKYAFGSGIQLN